jgi:hypothetical protein
MKIGSVILILGVINFLLVLFQISTGLHFIRVPFSVHRRTGILLFFTALIHGTLAMVAD